MRSSKAVFSIMLTGLLMFTLGITSCGDDGGAGGPILTIGFYFPGSNMVAGEPVSITGTNLSDATVTIAGITATLTSNTETQIETSVPAGVPLGPNEMRVSNSTGTLVIDIVIGIPPTITDISPANVDIGADITITGTGLGGGPVVTIATILADVVSSSETSLVVTIPTTGVAGGQQAAVRVTTQFGDVTGVVQVN